MCTSVDSIFHSGGRGKAGGVKLCRTYHDVAEATKAMLGVKLVTDQTGPAGKIVHRVYVEAAEPFEREIYLGSSATRTPAPGVRSIAGCRSPMDQIR